MGENRAQIVLQTNLPGALARRSGKVRDVYDYGDGLLIVATDRISVFDVVLPSGIPDKGRVLTGLSLFWFAKTAHLVPNHLLSARVEDFPQPVQPYADMLRGRSMWVRKAEVVPVECVVRGYLAGSAWKEYKATGRIGDHDLPSGLREADKLPEPIFTPTTKAESGHDEKITRTQVAEILGANLARRIEDLSLQLYNFAAAYVAERGFLLVDTKFEFGLADGKLILVDEILTPDSSRYWDASRWEPGHSQDGFDKQHVRDYTESTGWNKEPPGPELPPDVIARTRALYLQAYERITGHALPEA
ncbi:MAG: phosphoribosylaminoimidazolesuccinocarboxamide synthase [Armatimonadota bacterium]